MKFRRLVIATALLVLPAVAETVPSSPRVAVMRFQDVVLTTQEGQRAGVALKTKFDPRKAQFEKRQAELEAMQKKLETGAAIMTPQARAKMQDDLARGSRALQNDIDDLNTEVQQDEAKILQDMGPKMSAVIQKYAARNGFSLVLDVSSQQTPVIWAAPAANISAEIAKAYDEAYPVRAAK